MSEESANKSLLIIKAHASSLTTVENFLKNREWKIKSTTNLKEALVYLVQQQPQFVMVCIDHPNPKVKNLPKILTQAFPVCVIAFTEATSAAAYSMLSAAATEYMLYPPVTGPAVERTVNKYYKDQQAKAHAATHSRSSETGESEDDMIAIRGKGKSFGGADAHSILASMLGEDGHDVSIMQGSKGSLGDATMQGTGPGDLMSARGGPEDGDPQGHHSGSSGHKKNGGHWAPLPGKPPPKKERLTPEQIEANPMATKRESIILKGTKEALDNSCRVTSFEKAQSIEESTNVACIVVESSRFSGYLITAMGKNKSLDANFLTKVRERLFKFLKDSGEDLNEGESMDLKIKEVPFEDWALEYAEFMRKSIHDGNEVAMAFFPRQDIKTKYEDSHSEEMASIKIDEFVGDITVEFNVYIRLPRNDKYVLYTPRGGVFYNSQKERLQNQGVSQLHIMKADLKDVDKYRAQNFLNEKINEYEEKERREAELIKEKKIA